MSAAKFLFVSLFAVGSAMVTSSGTSANVLVSSQQMQARTQLLAVVQRGPERTPSNLLFSDEHPAARVTARASGQWLLVALLFVALVVYQLGRNQRALSHRLSSY
jgi:hypothetical protein